MTDTYSIKFSSENDTSGKKTAISVAPTAVDNSTSITIHGKYSTPFGEDLWTSLVHIMENFCSTTGPSPSKVTMGQLWFDSGTQTLKIWRLGNVAPFTAGWYPVNSFDNSGTLAVALSTSIANNGILDDTSTYDNYFVTRGYTNDHYLPKGNYVSGTTALSKAKIKYSTDVTFETGDTTALVTKKYVDDKVGVVGTLSISVAADGTMTATKGFKGSPNNLILDNTAAYDDYFITRDYADDRYLQIGTFVNSNFKQTVAKIQYSSDVVYASNNDDKYTLVHKQYVVDTITAAMAANASPTWIPTTVPNLGVLFSDGSALNSLGVMNSSGGNVLAINSAKTGFEWVPPSTGPALPDWVATAPAAGVVLSDGTGLSSIKATTDKQILASHVVSGSTSYVWSSLSDVGFAIPSAGVVTSNGTNLASTAYGTNKYLLSSTGTGLAWVDPASLVASSESLFSDGYLKMPNGFMIVWGSFPLDSNDNNIEGTCLFNTAFPTKCFQVIVGSTAGVISSGSASSEGFCVTSFTKTGFAYYSAWNHRYIVNQNLGPIMFIAIGN